MHEMHERFVAEAAALRKKADRLCEENARRRGTPLPDSHLLAIVPFNPEPLAPLSGAQRNRFRENLWKTISDNFASHPNVPTTPPQENHGADHSDAVAKKLGNACATCAGHCCLPGEGHAFIKDETILRYRYEQPDLGAEEILENYLAHIGAETYRNSCVYHGHQGCVLPRNMRSAVCNRFHCDGLLDLVDQIRARPSEDGYAAATQHNEVVGIAPLR